jgi:hypothetical protein
MSDKPTLQARPDVAKCAGIQCAYKHSCGRYLRPEGDRQVWGSYYALGDEDCDYFEPVINSRDL